MHYFTLQELKKLNPSFLKAEQTVILEPFNGASERIGKFDFLLQEGSELVGVEVLSRPSKGKLKKKLSYSKNVSKFIFVLPANSMQFYKKPREKVFRSQVREDFFPQEFNSASLYAWLFDPVSKTFTEKTLFNKTFNVK